MLQGGRGGALAELDWGARGWGSRRSRGDWKGHWQALEWGARDWEILGGCKAGGGTERAGCGVLDGNSRTALWGALAQPA